MYRRGGGGGNGSTVRAATSRIKDKVVIYVRVISNKYLPPRLAHNDFPSFSLSLSSLRDRKLIATAANLRCM